jgi:hypothetical protein
MRLIPSSPSSLIISLLAAVVFPAFGFSPVRVKATDFPGITCRANVQVSRPTIFAINLATQSTGASLEGRVVDQNGSVVRAAKIVVRNVAVSIERVVESDDRGNFQIVSLPVGTYHVEVQASGFKTKVVEHLEVQVGSTVVQDFRLEVGNITQTVNVTSEAPLVERATVSLGQVVNERTLQELPLRYARELALSWTWAWLVFPGSVTPRPQNGFLLSPLRGQGSCWCPILPATSGGYCPILQVNGINLNDSG